MTMVSEHKAWLGKSIAGHKVHRLYTPCMVSGKIVDDTRYLAQAFALCGYKPRGYWRWIGPETTTTHATCELCTGVKRD